MSHDDIFRGAVIFALGAGLFAGCCTCDYSTHGEGDGEGHVAKWKDGKDGEEMARVRLPNLVTLDGGYIRSTSQYDADGNKQDFGNDQSETSTFYRLAYRRAITRMDIGDGRSLVFGGLASLDYATRSFKGGMAYGGMSADRCGSGLRSARLEGDLAVRRLFQAPIRAKVLVGYQINVASDPDPNDQDFLDYSTRQNALYFGTEWAYLCHKWRLAMGAFYNITTERDNNGSTFDNGDYLGLSASGGYKFRVSEQIIIQPSLRVEYMSRSERSSNGTTLANSDGYLLGLTPAVGVGFRGTGLRVNLAYGYTDEFRGTNIGGIALAGKNAVVPNPAFSVGVGYRF